MSIFLFTDNADTTIVSVETDDLQVVSDDNTKRYCTFTVGSDEAIVFTNFTNRLGTSCKIKIDGNEVASGTLFGVKKNTITDRSSYQLMFNI